MLSIEKDAFIKLCGHFSLMPLLPMDAISLREALAKAEADLLALMKIEQQLLDEIHAMMRESSTPVRENEIQEWGKGSKKGSVSE